jgi:hypothetical protein
MRVRTITHTDAFGRALGAAAARGCNTKDKLSADEVRVYREHEASPFIVVKSPEFAPFKADAEKHGWQVGALPCVIPTLTKGARFAAWCALADYESLPESDAAHGTVQSKTGRQRHARATWLGHRAQEGNRWERAAPSCDRREGSPRCGD